MQIHLFVSFRVGYVCFYVVFDNIDLFTQSWYLSIIFDLYFQFSYKVVLFLGINLTWDRLWVFVVDRKDTRSVDNVWTLLVCRFL